jgi:hypothetical protein
MFTFEKQKQNPLFYIDDKPVYTVFKKDESHRIPPFRDTKKYLDSDEFRERYSLSLREAKELKNALRSNIVPDGALKGQFYRVRKDLNDRLYTEIDLRGTDKTISWRFPHKVKEWPETQIIIGSSGVGKTHKVVGELVEALKRGRKRKFVYVSPELNVDTTLKKLLNTKRWQKNFQGLDVSDSAFEEWQIENQGGNADQWWDKEIGAVLNNLEPGTFCVLDDAPDSFVHSQLQKWLIKYLRTGRHKKIGVGSIQHLVRGRRWTSQSFSSVKWITLFPRGGGKGKQVEFLYEQLGINRRKGRELVDLFGEHGRYMTIHQWSPTVIFGPKYALWV